MEMVISSLLIIQVLGPQGNLFESSQPLYSNGLVPSKAGSKAPWPPVLLLSHSGLASSDEPKHLSILVRVSYCKETKWLELSAPGRASVSGSGSRDVGMER